MSKSDKERIAVLEEQNDKTEKTIGIIFQKIKELPKEIGVVIEEKFKVVEKFESLKAEIQAKKCKGCEEDVEKLKIGFGEVSRFQDKEKIYLGVFATIAIVLFEGIKWVATTIVTKFF